MAQKVWETLLYADDCSLIYGASSYAELSGQINHDLITISSFFNKLNLKINFSKSKYMIFKPNPNLTFHSVNSNNHEIERVYCYKYPFHGSLKRDVFQKFDKVQSNDGVF